MLTSFLRSARGHRYLLIGGGVYVFEIIVILCAKSLGASDVWAVGLSYFTGVSLSFVLQKVFTFKSRSFKPKVVGWQLLAYGLLIAFNFGFTVLVAKLMSGAVPAVVSRTLALGLTTIWNFYLYKTKIFKVGQEPLIS